MTLRIRHAIACAIATLAAAPFAARAQDVSPVSRDTELKVESRFEPLPAETDWRHKPGMNGWTFDLAPDQTKRLSVSQALTFPKDSTVTNLPDIR